MVTNEAEITTVSGDAWEEFGRIYCIHIGQKVLFSIDELKGLDSCRVVSGHYPIVHPSNNLFNKTNTHEHNQTFQDMYEEESSKQP
jgi:hypothetical protein